MKKKPACMAVMRASVKKNWGVIGGFSLTTLGMVLLLIWIFLTAYVVSAALKKGSALLKVCFSRNVTIDVEQDLIRRYSSIRYRDYLCDINDLSFIAQYLSGAAVYGHYRIRQLYVGSA